MWPSALLKMNTFPYIFQDFWEEKQNNNIPEHLDP